MKVNSTSIFMGDDTRSIRHGEKVQNKKTFGKTINASELQKKFDPIAAKREQAQKKALGIVSKAFSNECKIDDDLDERRNHIREMLAENGEAGRAIREYEDMRIELRDRYAVDPDSQEEKDLRLLEKEEDSHRPDSQITLTDEEKTELERIKKIGLTEYQERSMEIRGYEGPHKDTIYHNKLEIQTENAIISATEIERLKSHAMIDAQEEAENILDEASKEIVGMLVDEAKEKIDDDLEEKVDEAKEKAEEKKELEEKIEKAKDEKKEKEKITEDILEGAADVSKNATELENAQQEIKDMMSKMKLIEDDIKGAAVDKTI